MSQNVERSNGLLIDTSFGEVTQGDDQSSDEIPFFTTASGATITGLALT